MSDEDELFLPRTVLQKFIKEALPDIRVSNDTRELISACCSEFIRMLAKGSSKLCDEQQKRTISGEHVIQALREAGFEEYVEEAEVTLKSCVEAVAKKRKVSHRLEHLGIPEEELLRQQQELFARAREEQAQEDLAQWQTVQDEVSRQLQAEQQQGEQEDDDYG